LRATWWGVPPDNMEDLPHLEDLAKASEPVLWFGPDPWEQACLLWILAELPEGSLPDLVNLDTGVGRMPPSLLPRCFVSRTALEPETIHEARALWQDFLSKGWGALGQARVPALPWLGPALARLAEDHPPSGMGRSRRQIQTLVDQGVRDLSALMRALERMEDPQYGAWFGDLYVARVLEAMGVRG
jgi:hypothetical protein